MFVRSVRFAKSFLFFPSYRKIVSEYEKTIAQMIGRCFCSQRCCPPLLFSEESLGMWLKSVGFILMLASPADAAGNWECIWGQQHVLPGCDGKPGLCFTESRPRGSPGNTEKSGLFLPHQSKQSHRKHYKCFTLNSWVSQGETANDLKTLWSAWLFNGWHRT